MQHVSLPKDVSPSRQTEGCPGHQDYILEVLGKDHLEELYNDWGQGYRVGSSDRNVMFILLMLNFILF